MHIIKFSCKAALLATLALSFQTNAEDWSGCYLGAHIGHGKGDNQLDILRFQDITYENRSAGSASSSGSMYGAQFGCDYQTSEKWVSGVQFSASKLDMNGEHLFIDGNGPNNYVNYDSDQSLSIVGKFGYLLKDTSMLYAKLGWVTTNQVYTDTDPDYDPPLFYQKSLSRKGWTVGVGFEHKFRDYVSYFFEVNHLALGREDNILFDNLGLIAIDDYEAAVDQSANLFTAGLNFYF